MGGYQIVDLKNINITENPVKIPGIYESIEGNYRKPILLANMVVGEKELPDYFSGWSTKGDTVYIFQLPMVELHINADDMVFIA